MTKGNEWRAFCKGERSDLPSLPKDIPATPDKSYKDKGWKGMGDWLGTGNVASSTKNKNWMPFSKARDFVRKLGLKNQAEWENYCDGRRPKLRAKPDNIPKYPARPYKNSGWEGFPDWLGVREGKKPEWLPFKEARVFAQSLGLKSQADWHKFARNNKRPGNIPYHPPHVYGELGWKNWHDWLGTEKR